MAVVNGEHAPENDPLGQLNSEANTVMAGLTRPNFDRLEDASNVAAAVTSDNDEGSGTSQTQQAPSPKQHPLAEMMRELCVGAQVDPSALTLQDDANMARRNTILAHASAAYVTQQDSQTHQQVASRALSELSDVLAATFGPADTPFFMHGSLEDGVARLLKLCLHRKYPDYGVLGYESLQRCTPVLYVSHACPPALHERLRRTVALSWLCVRRVAAPQSSTCAINVAALRQMLAADASSDDKCPLLVLTHTGPPYFDDIGAVRQACDEHGVWCHVTGPALAALALVHKTMPADSMTLDVASWLDLPVLPSVGKLTYYKLSESPRDGATVVASLIDPPAISDVLPYWAGLKSLGIASVVERVRSAFDVCASLHRRIANVKHIHILTCARNTNDQLALSIDPARHDQEDDDFSNLSCRMSSVLVFRYNYAAPTQCDADKAENSSAPVDIIDSVYQDNINIWLGQIIQRDMTELPVHLVNVTGVGFCLRFSSLIGQTLELTSQVLDQWVSSLQQQIEILDATVTQKHRLSRLLLCDSQDNDADSISSQLQLVPLSNWAGLGAVRYVPSHLRSLTQPSCDKQNHQTPPVWSSNDVDNINGINSELLKKLQSTDSAFSLGEADDGMVCIRFGMVTMETDVDELLAYLCEIGGEIEENDRYLQSMSQLVIKNIETASADLQREAEDALWQQGVLRHVPLVGSVVNWLSPVSAADCPRGRTLNLTDGVLESTVETYKSRAQRHSLSGPNVADSAASSDVCPTQPHPATNSNGDSVAQANSTIPETVQ